MERLKSQKVDPPPEVVGEYRWTFCKVVWLQVEIWVSNPPSLFQLRETHFQKCMLLTASSRLWYRKTSYKDTMLHPKILKIHLRNTSSNKIKSWPSRGSPSRTRTCRHQATRKQLKACITCNNPNTHYETFAALERTEEESLPSTSHRLGGREDDWSGIDSIPWKTPEVRKNCNP